MVNLFKWFILGNERLLFKHMNKGINEIEKVRKHNLWLGEQRGIEKGKIEGTKEEKLSIAKSMKELNIPLDKISKATGLSKEKINTL